MKYIKTHYGYYEYESNVHVLTLKRMNNKQNQSELSRPLQYFIDHLDDIQYIDSVKLMQDFITNVNKITGINYNKRENFTNLAIKEFDSLNYM